MGSSSNTRRGEGVGRDAGRTWASHDVLPRTRLPYYHTHLPRAVTVVPDVGSFGHMEHVSVASPGLSSDIRLYVEAALQE
jgi:hypothetical protein